jgi:transposase-like protein
MPAASTPTRHLSPTARLARDARALRLVEAGATMAKAARIVGVSRRQLRRRLAQLRAAAPPPPQDLS